jgi:hypothetical protein
MKGFLILIGCALLASVVMLLVLIRAPQDGDRPTSTVRASARETIAHAQPAPLTARVTVETERPMPPGLPPWTTLLPTLPASLPPPAGSEVPAFVEIRN